MPNLSKQTRFVFSTFSALRSTISNGSRKKISMKEIEFYCENISANVLQSFDAEIVVAIENGGRTPGELIAAKMKLPLRYMTIRRSVLKIRFDDTPSAIRWFKCFYNHYLFHSTNPSILVKLNSCVKGMRILVVDDAIHTGATIDLALEYLDSLGASEVRVAALSYVANRRAEFSALPRGNYSYPWSEDF
jgi:hypoxanthine phosphoribosyltransferase